MSKRLLEGSDRHTTRPRIEPVTVQGSTDEQASQGIKLSSSSADSRTSVEPLPAPVISIGAAAPGEAPTLLARPRDFEQLGLTEAIWKLIFVQLDCVDLIATRRSCRGHYQWGEPFSTSPMQRQYTRGQLLPVLEAYKAKASQEELRPLVARYGEILSRLACRQQSLDLWILPGFETHAVDALLQGTSWQFAKITVSQDADSGLVRRLEQGLQQQGRHRSLDLVLRSPGRLEQVLPLGTALSLEGLELNMPQCDLAPLKPLLADKNRMRRLFISGDATSDTVLPWLLAGTHELLNLHLDDVPAARNCPAMLEMLGKKAKLVSLGLANGTFQEGRVTLAQVLRAVPQVKELTLISIDFKAGSDTGSKIALQSSCLREIRFDECILETEVDGPEDQQACRAAHAGLLDGLSVAPQLEVLVIEANGCEGNARLLLEAWARNPAARVIEYTDGDELEFVKDMQTDLNEQRSREGMIPLAIRFRSSDYLPVD